MQRSAKWEDLQMAQGDPRPQWPLPSVKPTFSTSSVGGGRPFNCAPGKCERWHAGIDLTKAPDGALIVAPEDATVIAINASWSEGSRAAFLRTKTGLFVVLGGFKFDSNKEFKVNKGDQVKKGDSLGRVLGSYGMIHLETYEAADRTKNSPWWAADPPPEGLLNPTSYVELMTGDYVSLVLPRQRHQALAKLGFYKGDENAPWGPASVAALAACQASLGITSDGKWGPQTETAIRSALLGNKPGVDTDSSAETGAEPSTDTEGSEPLVLVDAFPNWAKVALGAATAAAIVSVAVVVWRRS